MRLYRCPNCGITMDLVLQREDETTFACRNVKCPVASMTVSEPRKENSR